MAASLLTRTGANYLFSAGNESKYRVGNSMQNAHGAPWGGTKARQGLMSAFDSDQIKKRAEERQNAWKVGANGTPGLISFKLEGADKDTPLNWNGRTYYPDSDGTFRILSEEYLKEEIETRRRVEEELNDLVEYAATSDDACATLLGVTTPDLGDLLGLDKGPQTMPLSLKKVDATPSVAVAYGGDTQLYALAMAKIKYYLREKRFVIENTKRRNDSATDSTAMPK